MRENHFIVTGNICQDWKVMERSSQKTNSTIYICETLLIYDDGYFSSEGGKEKWVEKPVFIPLKYVSKNQKPMYLIDHKAHKGSKVYVAGRLTQDQWEGKDGTKKSKMYVEIDRIQQISPSKHYVKPEGGFQKQYGKGSVDIKAERNADARNIDSDDLMF